MIIPKLTLRLNAFKQSLNAYSLNLVMEETLTEAIKKDDVNLYEYASLKIAGESDIDHANRLLSIAKNQRLNRVTLHSLRIGMKNVQSDIINHLFMLPDKRIPYILKRDGYRDRKYVFELLLNGELNTYLTS